LLERFDAQVVDWQGVGGRLGFVILVHRSRPYGVACGVRSNSDCVPAVPHLSDIALYRAMNRTMNQDAAKAEG
jgi:hypothetical protein